MTGCVDSEPNLSTSECQTSGKTRLTIHGLDFQTDLLTPTEVKVKVGGQPCDEPRIVNAWKITCRLGPGSDQDLAVSIMFTVIIPG